MDNTPQDATLWVNGTTSNISRMLQNTACVPNATEAVGGHGYINTNIVGGYDVRANSEVVGARFPITDVASGMGYQCGLGINPFARFAGTRIFTGGGSYDVTNCGGNDVGVIKRNQDNGAAISTNPGVRLLAVPTTTHRKPTMRVHVTLTRRKPAISRCFSYSPRATPGRVPTPSARPVPARTS